MGKQVRRRRHDAGPLVDGRVPLLDVAGSAADCGEALGHAWRRALREQAAERDAGRPWWQEPSLARLLDRLAPHLPDLYRGMARGAGLRPEQVGDQPRYPVRDGCTSFAIAPQAALARQPLSGQTKDTPANRLDLYCLLRMRLRGGRGSMLTLTYPGWLMGHGFVQGGCALFGNSLWAGPSAGRLPRHAWLMLAHHCPTAEEAWKLARDHGVEAAEGGHTTVADEHGGIVGIEVGTGGVAALRPKNGLYVHANAVVSGARLRRHETRDSLFTRRDSLRREARLRKLLAPDRGRLTPQTLFAACCDHDSDPVGVCRHQSDHAQTTALVIAEPTRGLLHVAGGAPCRTWPTTHALAPEDACSAC